MDHVAIMNKKWRLIDKILSGEKTIESRWYKTRRAPWNRIKRGDYIYFKDSGESVTVRATVTKVKQHILTFDDTLSRSDLNRGSEFYNYSSTPEEIYQKYGKKIGVDKKELQRSILNKKDKKYCILILLSKPQKIDPFDIDKSGFGVATAWICVNKIDNIKK